MKNKTVLIVILVLVIASFVSFTSYLPTRFDAAASTNVADFPRTVGEWTSTDMPIADDVYRILETRNLFIRDYRNSQGDSIYLYIVYSEDNRKVSHPPEVCLLGSGVSIADKSGVNATSSIKATKLIVEKSTTREMVFYWFKAGALSTDKYLTQQLKIVTDRLFGKRTSGALIRLSTTIKGDDVKSAQELLKSFSAQIEPLLARHIP